LSTASAVASAAVAAAWSRRRRQRPERCLQTRRGLEHRPRKPASLACLSPHRLRRRGGARRAAGSTTARPGSRRRRRGGRPTTASAPPPVHRHPVRAMPPGARCHTSGSTTPPTPAQQHRSVSWAYPADPRQHLRHGLRRKALRPQGCAVGYHVPEVPACMTPMAPRPSASTLRRAVSLRERRRPMAIVLPLRRRPGPGSPDTPASLQRQPPWQPRSRCREA